MKIMRCVRRLFGAVNPWLVRLAACGSWAAHDVQAGPDRPNILLAIADDWSWPHAGAYGDAVVATPTFDRLAREGVLFQHAYVSAPSCTASRGALLTGQWHWRLRRGGLVERFPGRVRDVPGNSWPRPATKSA